MSMQTASENSEGEPIMEMNTTPLIDVMLVLLIMFIITIPIQTHAVKLDLPQPSDQPMDNIDPVKNKVIIDPAGTVFWNGAPVDLPAPELVTPEWLTCDEALRGGIDQGRVIIRTRDR